MVDDSDKGGRVDDMGRPEHLLEKIRYIPILKGSDALARRIGRRLVSPYQVLLALNDLLVINLAFSCGLLVTGYSAFLWQNAQRGANLFVLSLGLMAFFQAYHLYSYHHIFTTREHLFNLLKSLFWGCLALSITLVFYLYPGLLSGPTGVYSIVMMVVAVLILSRFYWNYLIYFMMSVGVSFLTTGTLVLINSGERPLFMESGGTLPVCCLMAIGFLAVSRYFWVHVVFHRWMRRHFRRQVAIVGTGKEAGRIASHILTMNAPFWVNGFVGEQASQSPVLPMAKRRLGELKNLPSIIEEVGIDEVVITDESIDKATLVSLLDYCTSEGVTVWFPPKVMPVIDVKVYIDSFCGLPMIRLCAQKHNWLFNKIKHGLDAVIAVPVFLMLLPLFAVVALAIKMNSAGPVFYRARAIGKGGREFTMFKFRSMKVNNTSDIHKQYVTKLIKGEIQPEGSGKNVLKITDDPRITSVGRFLRKLSLDELPQILNVLRGEMSFVGPRPCLPYEYEIYKDWHKKRLSVRPGITGLWQVAGRSEVLFEDMVLLDLYYLYNRNLLMDMGIIYETIFVVLKKKGAY